MQLQPISGPDAERLALEHIARAGARLLTNYFGQSLPKNGTSCQLSDSSLVILAAERDFYRLYYVSSDAGDLGTLVAGASPHAESVIEQVRKGVRALPFDAPAFAPLANYVRMQNRDMTRFDTNDKLAFASRQDVDTLDRLLLGAFDARTDHLPDRDTLLRRIDREEVIVRRIAGRLCGFVVFVVDGATANFNYVYSDCGDRTETAAMIENFYAVARQRGARRTFLWVDDRKSGVIRLYERFGWAPDGLVASYYVRANEPRS